MQLGGAQAGLVDELDDPLDGALSRKMPTVRISGGRRLAMSAARDTARNRGEDGTKLKPTASAPMATARRASSSEVMPQILTNTRWRLPTRHAEVGDRLRRIARRHDGLPHQHRVEPRLGEPARVVGPRMPDSATRSTSAGIAAPDADRPVGVDLEGDQVPLVHADQVGARTAMARSSSASSWTSTSTSRPSSTGDGVEVGELGVVEGRHDQEHGVGAHEPGVARRPARRP